MIVEGDAELLQAIQAAQLTSEAQFRRGRLVMETHDEWLGGLHSHAVLTVLWDENNTFLEADYHTEAIKDPAVYDFFDPSHRIREADKEVQDSRLIAIETPQMVCRYRPSIRHAHVEWRTGGMSLMPIFEGRPDRLWVTSFRSNILFSRMFDVKHPKAPDLFVVRPLDDDRVVIERSRDGSTPRVTTVSTRIGLRVVEHVSTTEPRADGKIPKRVDVSRYQWEQLADGFWVVRALEETQSFPDLSDKPFLRYRASLREYDPDPAIPSDRFKVEGLRLPPGTEVTEFRGTPPNLKQKSYTVGGQGELPQQLLDSLADELKESGFGSKKAVD